VAGGCAPRPLLWTVFPVETPSKNPGYAPVITA